MLIKLEKVLCKSLILILPLHYFLFIIIFENISFLKYIKDILIILLFLITILNKYKKNNKINFFVFIFLITLIVYLINAKYFNLAIYNCRIYVEPILLYFACKKMDLNEMCCKKILDFMIKLGIAISIYGLIQAIILGENFLVKMGYPLVNGQLSHVYKISGLTGFQRATGTLVYPNAFGFYLGLILIILLSYENIFKCKRTFKYIELIIIYATLIMTFSRSSWVAYLVVLIFTILKEKKGFKLKELVILTTIINIFVITYIFFYDIGIYAKMTHYIQRTLSFEDTSVVGHLDSFTKSFEIIKTNFWGTGLGINGPKALRYIKNPILTESSYFLMLFETGPIGFFAYYGIYLSIIMEKFKKLKVQKNKKEIATSNCIIYVTIFVLITYIFLPNIQDMEIISYYFIIVGLLSNRCFYRYKIN